VSSIYGIDILEDNAEECRKRLFAVFDEAYTRLFKEEESTVISCHAKGEHYDQQTVF